MNKIYCIGFILIIQLFSSCSRNSSVTKLNNNKSDVSVSERYSDYNFNNGLVVLDSITTKLCPNVNLDIAWYRDGKLAIPPSFIVKRCLLPKALAGSELHREELVKLLKDIPASEYFDLSFMKHQFYGEEIFEVLLSKANNFKYRYDSHGMTYPEAFTPFTYATEMIIKVDNDSINDYITKKWEEKYGGTIIKTKEDKEFFFNNPEDFTMKLTVKHLKEDLKKGLIEVKDWPTQQN